MVRRQHGLITTNQLLAMGLTRWFIDYRVKSGRLHPIHRGVYAVGHQALDLDDHFHAAVLAVGPDAVLSHVSAAVLWGLVRSPGVGEPIHVTTTRWVRSRPRVRVHVTRSLRPADRTRRYNIPVTRPERTLADVAAVLPDGVLRRALREAQVQRLVDIKALAVQLRSGRAGAARLRVLIGAGPTPTRSELEDRALDLFLQHGLPRPRVNAILRVGGRAYEVDFLFVEQRVVVEVDGDRFHGTRLARDRDAAKQLALEAAGYRVIRLTWRQVTAEGADTVRRLRLIVQPWGRRSV